MMQFLISFICIGPLRITVGDFWHMIWEYKLNSIVMLTGIIEGGKVNFMEMITLSELLFSIFRKNVSSTGLIKLERHSLQRLDYKCHWTQ